MYCPKCAQERLSDETKFCSRCGYLLTGTSELLENDGVLPRSENSELSKRQSPRNRGLKQGLFIFLLTFLIVPLLAIIATAIDTQPDAALVAGTVFGVGGLLRIAYALLFESAVSGAPTVEDKLVSGTMALANRHREINLLSPQNASTADVFAAPTTGQWRTTEELQSPAGSEKTTKLLERDDLS